MRSEERGGYSIENEGREEKNWAGAQLAKKPRLFCGEPAED